MSNDLQFTLWKLWTLRYRNLTIEVKRRDASESMKRALGYDAEWFYYVYLYESYCKDFESLWLPPKFVRYSEDGPEHVTYDYSAAPVFNDIEMHGGMTYYAKHGTLAGHRAVQIGCDFQHLWDEGKRYEFEDARDEAIATANQCVELLYKL